MSEENFSELKRILDDHERRISALEGMPEKLKSAGKKLSIKEFVLTKNPVDDVQRALVIGYYLENFDGAEAFNVRDLTEGFRLARERVPLNMNDKVNMNRAKGYMMKAGGKKDNLKAWVLTSLGERFVDGGLNTEG
jgi:hypothetical protein